MFANILYIGRHKGISQMFLLTNGRNLGKIPIGREFYLEESFMSANI